MLLFSELFFAVLVFFFVIFTVRILFFGVRNIMLDIFVYFISLVFQTPEIH